jgi:hypothetical protein
MKQRHDILTLVSIYEMGDTPAIVIKGDVLAFMIEDGIGNAPAFMIKGDTPLATYVSFTCIIGDAQ